jgi:hypothetical protein
MKVIAMFILFVSYWFQKSRDSVDSAPGNAATIASDEGDLKAFRQSYRRGIKKDGHGVGKTSHRWIYQVWFILIWALKFSRHLKKEHSISHLYTRTVGSHFY